MKQYFFIFLFLLSFKPIFSQNTIISDSSNSRPNEEKYNNIQFYTPSVLLTKRQLEFKTFQNIYTQTKVFDKKGKVVKTGSRSTYLTSINQFTYGLSGKLNIGIDTWYKGVMIHGTGESPFNILSPKNSSINRSSFIYIGPRIKISPFNRLPNTAIQSTLLLPTGKDTEGRSRKGKESGLFLEADRMLWINELLFDDQSNRKFRPFLRIAFWVSLPRNSYIKNVYVETPITAYYNYFLNKKLTIYAIAEIWYRHINEPFSSYFGQIGPGIKYQLINGRLEIETSYTKFLSGSTNQGAGDTFNMGLRFIR